MHSHWSRMILSDKLWGKCSPTVPQLPINAPTGEVDFSSFRLSDLPGVENLLPANRVPRITNRMVRRFYLVSCLCTRGLRRRHPMELHIIGIDLGKTVFHLVG